MKKPRVGLNHPAIMTRQRFITRGTGGTPKNKTRLHEARRGTYCNPTVVDPEDEVILVPKRDGVPLRPYAVSCALRFLVGTGVASRGSIRSAHPSLNGSMFTCQRSRLGGYILNR